MSIWKNGRKVNEVFVNGRAISAIYKGGRKVWELITEAICCFSNGRWIDDYPWDDNETWVE